MDNRIELSSPRSYRLIARMYVIPEEVARRVFKIKSYMKVKESE